MLSIKKKNIPAPIRYFGLIPSRDKSLDTVLDGFCPDCNGVSFNIQIKTDITYATCSTCASKYVVSPICIERIME